MKTCISVKELYEKKGSQLTYGRIEKTDDVGDKFFDLYNEHGKLFACDGENVLCVSKDNGLVTLEAIDSGETMSLTPEEYGIAVFSQEAPVNSEVQKERFEFGKRLMESYDFFKSKHPNCPSKFVLIDLTTVSNPEDYYDALQNDLAIEFLDKEVISLKQGTEKELQLHSTISFDFLDCNSPLLYFVDSFASLSRNDPWFKMRNIEKDIIIDRRGNILSCTEIVQDRIAMLGEGKHDGFLEEAMKRFAAAPDAPPITQAWQVPERWRKHIVCKPMDPEWKQAISSKNWSLAYDGPNQLDQGMLELRDRLLSFGGEEACMAFEEPDMDELLKYGQLWNGWSNVRVKKGRRCGCHENSARLAKADGTGSFAVATGYALSDDGMWRQHSWCVADSPKGIQIVETTARRLLYFGVVLAGARQDDFIAKNI